MEIFSKEKFKNSILNQDFEKENLKNLLEKINKIKYIEEKEEKEEKEEENKTNQLNEIKNIFIKYNKHTKEFEYKFKKNYEYLKIISEIQLIQINLLSKKNKEKEYNEKYPKIKKFCLNCGSRDHKNITCLKKCLICCKLFCDGFRCKEFIDLKNYIYKQYKTNINSKCNEVECILFAIDVIKEWQSEDIDNNLFNKYDCIKRFFKFLLYKEKKKYNEDNKNKLI